MNIDHLQTFIVLARTLNYTQTAKLVNLTQPAVTQAIKSLERELNVKLVDRNQRSVRLTQVGQLFYEKVQPLIEELRTAINNVQTMSERTDSSITIGYTGTIFETRNLPIIIKQFNDCHPDATVYLGNFKQDKLIHYLLDHQCDLIFQTLDAVGDMPNVEFTSLKKGHFVGVVPKHHRLAEQQQLTMNDLKQETLIMMNNQQCPPEQKKIQDAIRRACPGATIYYSDSVLMLHSMIEQGTGISIIPDFVADTQQRQVTLVPFVDAPMDLLYGIAVLKDCSLPVR